MRRFGATLFVLVAGLLIGAAIVGTLRVGSLFGRGPDPETIAAASLQSVKEQDRLTVFAARFVAVVTSEQGRFGLSARKTLIMPGTVRYDLDLSTMRQRDLAWDAANRTLTVTLPPIAISPPAVEIANIREYSGGGILMALTDAEHRLDDANRAAGVKELARQAADPLPMRLARDAAINAIERSFAMPLKAAGVNATVVAKFGA